MNKPESLDTRFDGSDEFNSDQLLTTLQLKVIYLESRRLICRMAITLIETLDCLMISYPMMTNLILTETLYTRINTPNR